MTLPEKTVAVFSAKGGHQGELEELLRGMVNPPAPSPATCVTICGKTSIFRIASFLTSCTRT